MNGRTEKDKQFEKYIENSIDKRPEYLRNYVATLSDILPRTQHVYVFAIIRFLNYLEEELGLDTYDSSIFAKLKPSTISMYLSNFEEKSRKTIYFALKKFFTFLEMDGYIEKNQFLKIKSPKRPKLNEAVSLTAGEIQMLFYNLKHPEQVALVKPVSRTVLGARKKLINRNVLLVEMALTDGLRNSSLLEINVSDIDFENHRIPITQKGDKRYYAEMTESIESEIKTWLKDRQEILDKYNVETDALFVGVKGKRMTGAQFGRLLEWATYNIDKHITPHKLRSTCATMIYDKTGDIYLASEVLGHSSVMVTQRYIKSDSSKKVGATKLMESILHTD